MNPYLARLRALSPETQHPGVTGKPTKPPALVESERALIAAEHSSAHENRHHEELTKPTKPSFVSLVSDQGMRISKFEGPVAGAHYAHLLSALNEARPAFVEHDRWRQAVVDAKRFLAKWGEVAQQLGWTGKELFGLHRVPERPSGSYSRLSRYDETDLIWLLRGGGM